MNLAKLMIPKCSTVCLMKNSTVRQGLEIMRHHGYTAIPVLDEKGMYMGSVTEGDFLRHMLRVGSTDLKVHEHYLVGDIFRPDFCAALPINASEEEVISVALNQNYMPIVDGRNCLSGIVTRKAVIQYLSEKQKNGEEKSQSCILETKAAEV